MPNIAIISASLQQNGKTATDALNTVNSIIKQIINVLQSNGVNKTDIATSSLSVYPQYNYTNGTSVIIGETVYVTLTITIRGIDTDSTKVAKIIDGVVGAGVNSIYGITYDTSDPNAGKSNARKAAWNNAVTKGKHYAQLSGRKLGKVLVID